MTKRKFRIATYMKGFRAGYDRFLKTRDWKPVYPADNYNYSLVPGVEIYIVNKTGKTHYFYVEVSELE